MTDFNQHTLSADTCDQARAMAREFLALGDERRAAFIEQGFLGMIAFIEKDGTVDVENAGYFPGENTKHVIDTESAKHDKFMVITSDPDILEMRPSNTIVIVTSESFMSTLDQETADEGDRTPSQIGMENVQLVLNDLCVKSVE